MTKRFKLLSGVSLAFVAAHAQEAMAQDAQAQSGAAVQEILVTAQRREQNMQDVPVSVAAFSADQLVSSGATGSAQYLAMTPNVGFSEDAGVGSRGVNISIRGVSDLKTGENSVINSIGVYLDGFSVTGSASGAFNPQLADLDRIEVLRGPQGTYFGRNSLGGALNLTTKRPTSNFEGSLTGDMRHFDGGGMLFSSTAVVNVPVSETLAIRGVGFFEHSDGTVKNINPTGVGTGHQYWTGRISARWEPTPATTVDLMVMYSDEHQDGDESVPSGVLSLDTVDGFNLGATNLTEAVDPGTGFWPSNTNKTSRDLKEFNDITSTTAILNVSHELTDSLTLKGVFGYLGTKVNRLFDNDELGGWDNFYRMGDLEGDSYSGELRTEFQTGGLTWTTGVLYARDKTTRNDFVLAGTEADAPVGPNGPDPMGVSLLPPLPPGLCFLCSYKEFELESFAAFTDLDVQVTDALEVLIGGRYTHDKVTTSVTTFGPIYPTVYSQLNSATGSPSFNDFSPRLGLVYHVNDDMRLYATVSKGYKAGGTSVGFNPAPTDTLPAILNVPFKPETLWNYEGGLKSELFDRRLRFNLSAFYLRWSDLQIEVFRFLEPGNLSSKFALTANFPRARAYGVEAEFEAAVTEEFTLAGSVGYLDSKIVKSGPQILSGGFEVDLAGLPMANSPKFTANLSAAYRRELGDGDIWLRTDFIHRDHQYSNVEALVWQQIRGRELPSHAPGTTFLPETPNGFPFKVPSYDVVNVSGGYDIGDFKISAFVENLFAEKYYTGTGESFAITGIRLHPHPRTFGMRLSVAFGD